MQSEYSVGKGRQRIDFRQHGNNPVVIELVIRFHGIEHYGNSNVSELGKLSRVPVARARKAILLIIDVSGQRAIKKESLRKNYRKVGAGKGRGERRSVTVMYVHPLTRYNFRWNGKR